MVANWISIQSAAKIDVLPWRFIADYVDEC
jgi:hypothetical protein